MDEDQISELLRRANVIDVADLPDPRESPEARRLLESILYERVVATPRPLQSQRSARKPYRLIAIAAVVGLGLLIPAIAVGTGAFNLLDNEPAPPAVSKELGAPAFGLAQLTTSTGRVAALYRADKGAGECTYVRIVDAASARPGLSSAVCNPKPDDARPIMRFSQLWQRVDGKSLELMTGKVAQNVASVGVVFRSGAVASIPLSHGYFLSELSNAPPAAAVVAKNRAGDVVDRRTIENVRPPTGP